MRLIIVPLSTRICASTIACGRIPVLKQLDEMTQAQKRSIGRLRLFSLKDIRKLYVKRFGRRCLYALAPTLLSRGLLYRLIEQS
jgi:hypothetical protein